MYIFGFPGILTEMGLYFTFILLLLTFTATISRLPFSRKLLKNNITDPLSRWIEVRVVEATAPQRERVESFERYVKYHLGPNGKTPPVHERIKNLEKDSAIGGTRQRRFMDNIDVLIAESDATGETTFVNMALCELLECDPEDWYGEGWKNFIAPEQLAAEVERWESVLANEVNNPFHLVTLITKQTHRRIPTKARAHPLHASGELIGYIGEMYPIHEEDLDHLFTHSNS